MTFGGGSGGGGSIAGDSDVALNNPANTQVLTYNGTIAKWTNQASSSINHTFRLSYTWTISGGVNVPAGDTDYINPVFVGLTSGQTGVLVGYKAIINSGTSVIVTVKKNGSSVGSLSNLNITTTAGGTSGLSVVLSDGDSLAPVVSAVSGGPQNLSFTLFYEVTH